MGMISTAQFKKGIYLLFHDEPHLVVDISFVSPGKGSAFYKVKFKNLYTGRVLEYTYKSGEKVEEVLVETHEAEYSYFDGSNYVFIEPRTFDQYMVPVEVIGDDKVYLKEGLLYRLKFYEENPVGVTLPKSIACTVVETENSIKGDTATSAMKNAVLDTGAKVLVPLFIKNGEEIIVSTESGAYLSRKT
ncbi:MAG: Elongation factor P [Candidatus Shapirobacteria bacterium GW2011_GWE1_38_10]|uniref:Elongation factor P n=1 Tax=Candidatus Shapirobacteria bacterium GW2011_GWE1_38_10 TaxID=1618488 RepID=A0A0G0IH86_9BACT|nr:MAG: Elongation factor P [Candidatus Shapirobacteria bacterium GW2011_GWF2_37_20]KKQ50365.1 MAG: Elongation factor P [Candidatus Shapirobacteria bacterium GW2011_GWE1_38_10]KKQ65189.1 MAG: Elongation factor P [Candidatus Shapirobacteria bacterium GW2011_GWF1_38_23]HBP50786.1 elongation factor P [Candidatus Shapirobacteria bacterium]